VIWSPRFFSLFIKPYLEVNQGQWSDHKSSGLTRVNLCQPNSFVFIKKNQNDTI
jgi:hypothetical protein